MPATMPCQPHSDTSRSAARRAGRGANTILARVQRYFEERRQSTDEQMMDALDLEISNGIPRRVELVRSGVLRDSGRRWTNRSGRKAVVWEVVPPAS
jgi:hypothetical protein